MQTIQLQNLGVSELAANEFETITGGEIPVWLKGVSWVSIAGAVVENWEDIKQGLSDGWNSFDVK